MAKRRLPPLCQHCGLMRSLHTGAYNQGHAFEARTGTEAETTERRPRSGRTPGSMVDQDTIDIITARAFADHSGCKCFDAGHALAIAAHAIISVETPRGFENNAQREATINRIWNGTSAKAYRTCHSALWRALWSARNQKIVKLDMTATPEPVAVGSGRPSGWGNA